jgi:serine/threonine protein kinase
MPLARGARIGAYEVVDLLGAGGMGEVYRAHDAKLARSVAIKVLNFDAGANAAAVRRFEQEARTASSLNHPGIVTIHDTGHSDGQFYIVMELIDGVTLRHLLRRAAPPPLKKALQIASQLADALAKAHEVGVIHRDLKPENIMVTGDGHVKVVDFGLAKLAEPAFDFGSQDQSATQSAQGAMVGTVGYMSPEQVRGEPADARADQFAFGAILYELVTGTRAFQRATSVETLTMILNEEPPPPLSLKPALPGPLIWTIERCLSKDRADRYTSTRDLAREMQTLRDHTSELLPIDRRPLTATRRARVLMTAALAIAVAAAVYIGLQSDQIARRGADQPSYTQLTFRRGHITNARFAPDGRILYAAAWRGAPIHVFETRPSGPESRPIGPPAASIASVSPTGELALILGCRFDFSNCVGTLARMPTGGGAPRELLEDVVSADWAPDGQTLAAIQATGGEYQLQFPAGKPIYTSTGKLGFVRFSPRGDRIAFVEYPLFSDEAGVLRITDLQGHATTVSRRFREIRDVVWTRTGDELFVTASEQRRMNGIYAVTLSGTQRLVTNGPGGIHVLDVAPDGRALVMHGSALAHMVWSRGAEERDLSWLDWTTVADVSADGKTVLFYEWGEATGANPAVYLRALDGTDAVRLGDGKALALSHDGRWALALREMPRQQLVLLPTGAGESRTLPTEGLTDFYWARWFPDGLRLLVVGSGADGVPSSYIQHLDTGRLEPLADKGLLAVLVSPESRRVLMNDPLKGYLIWPLDGTEAVALPALDPRDRPVQWSADGRFLFVRGPEDALVRMHRFEIATGKKEQVKELVPQDTSGLIGVATGRGELAVTPDGTTYVYTYWTFLRYLFLVEGLVP